MRIAAHHLIHAGEIVTVRSCLGHDTDKLDSLVKPVLRKFQRFSTSARYRMLG